MYIQHVKKLFFCLLDSVTVLPPGEWDPSIRIEPPQSLPSQESRKHPKEAKDVVDEEEEEEKQRESAGLVRSGRYLHCPWGRGYICRHFRIFAKAENRVRNLFSQKI